MEKEIKDLENLLVECKKISIVTHFNPDGDAIDVNQEFTYPMRI